MKKLLVLIAIVVFVLSSSVFAQDMQYVSSQSGDTLVVKDDIEFGGINTLTLLMASDSLAPAGRVYVLKANGIYSLGNNPVSSATNKTVIMGSNTESLKTSTGDAPPVVSGANITGTVTSGGMNIGKDLLVKNVSLEIGNSAGNTSGWAWFNFSGPGQRVQVDNCILEHTWWVWVGGPQADSRIFFTNSYLTNLTGHSCRRNGGVVDINGTATHMDSLVVENCTHVHNQGILYKFREGYVTGKAIFNHNDFINNSSFVIMSNGNTANMSVTNNIFINCNLQAYSDTLYVADVGEVDKDKLPMGMVNVRDDSTFQANGASFYADCNLAYWDASLADIPATLNAAAVNDMTDWVSQMIPMNSRTAAIFADDATYPLCTNGVWYSQMPTFADTKDLFTTALATIKAYSIASVDVTYGTPLDSWRQPGNEELTNFIYADWPCPVDLSYTDADLLTGGIGGFPVGDLNWFPTQNAAWEAQKATEYAKIQQVLDTGDITVAVKANKGVDTYQLAQNYPNPFNPATKIQFTIGKMSNVKLTVYNALGQEVATLVNKTLNAGQHEYAFDGSNLVSGIYIYRLEADNFVQQNKMLLVK